MRPIPPQSNCTFWKDYSKERLWTFRLLHYTIYMLTRVSLQTHFNGLCSNNVVYATDVYHKLQYKTQPYALFILKDELLKVYKVPYKKKTIKF
jgi:hypothetical protein